MAACGLQKEAFYFQVPCVTLRRETEWVETVETGWNRLAGSDAGTLVEIVRTLRPGKKDVFPYGDGGAALRIVEYLDP